MTIGIKQRAEAYLEAANEVRAIEDEQRPESERLEKITTVLLDLARRSELFPIHAFPRTPGTPGGLFRLAEFPDRKGTIYMSLGFTGRTQTPHRHASWAIVAGVSGGTETNTLYDFEKDDSAPNAARLHRRGEFVVGPGQAVSIETGVYHTINVVSDTPVLHLHAYGLSVDKEGFELPTFESADARTFGTRATGGFRPPLSIVQDEDIRADIAQGHAVLLVLDGSAPVFAGPHVYRGSANTLNEAKIEKQTPIVLVGSDAVVLEAARALYAAGYPLIFQHRSAASASAAA
ncbi:MAG: hypothetical protein ABW199_06295 [Caulobacterales bacterium]